MRPKAKLQIGAFLSIGNFYIVISYLNFKIYFIYISIIANEILENWALKLQIRSKLGLSIKKLLVDLRTRESFNFL